MTGFFARIGKFLKEVRRSDERTKKRWLVIFSGIGMIFIVVLWVTYLNATLPRESDVTESTSTVPVMPTAAKEEGRSFFKTFELGWNTVWGKIENGVGAIGESLGDSWTKLNEELKRTNELNLEKPQN